MPLFMITCANLKIMDQTGDTKDATQEDIMCKTKKNSTCSLTAKTGVPNHLTMITIEAQIKELTDLKLAANLQDKLNQDKKDQNKKKGREQKSNTHKTRMTFPQETAKER